MFLTSFPSLSLFLFLLSFIFLLSFPPLSADQNSCDGTSYVCDHHVRVRFKDGTVGDLIVTGHCNFWHYCVANDMKWSLEQAGASALSALSAEAESQSGSDSEPVGPAVPLPIIDNHCVNSQDLTQHHPHDSQVSVSTKSPCPYFVKVHNSYGIDDVISVPGYCWKSNCYPNDLLYSLQHVGATEFSAVSAIGEEEEEKEKQNSIHRRERKIKLNPKGSESKGETANVFLKIRIQRENEEEEEDEEKEE